MVSKLEVHPQDLVCMATCPILAAHCLHHRYRQRRTILVGLNIWWAALLTELEKVFRETFLSPFPPLKDLIFYLCFQLPRWVYFKAPALSTQKTFGIMIKNALFFLFCPLKGYLICMCRLFLMLCLTTFFFQPHCNFFSWVFSVSFSYFIFPVSLSLSSPFLSRSLLSEMRTQLYSC